MFLDLKERSVSVRVGNPRSLQFSGLCIGWCVSESHVKVGGKVADKRSDMLLITVTEIKIYTFDSGSLPVQDRLQCPWLTTTFLPPQTAVYLVAFVTEIYTVEVFQEIEDPGQRKRSFPATIANRSILRSWVQTRDRRGVHPSGGSSVTLFVSHAARS